MKKYFFSLLGFLLLAGAGCGTVQNNALEPAKPNTTTKSEQPVTTNFHVYYPTFLPSGVAKDDKPVVGKDYAGLMLSDGKDFIVIMENISNQRVSVTPIMNRLDKLTAKEQILINDTTGYFGLYSNGTATFNTILFSTKDGTDIGIWSNTYGKDTLLQIAQSMN